MPFKGMQIKKMKLAELKPAPYNPRYLTAADREALKKSIQAYGLVQPLVWNKRTGHVVGGNQRLLILQEMGVEEVEVVVVDLSLDEEKTLNLALNKIGGEWDNNKLVDVLTSLPDDLKELTGFTELEIEDLLSFGVKEIFTEVKKPKIKRYFTCPQCGTKFTKDGEIVE